jgi:hypothetical protein
LLHQECTEHLDISPVNKQNDESAFSSLGGIGRRESMHLEVDVNTFGGNLKLAALDDLDGLNRLIARCGLGVLDLLDDLVALEDFTEDDVAAI